MEEVQADVSLILGWKDSLQEGVATHSSILAWRIPWTEEPSGLQSIGSQSWTQLRYLVIANIIFLDYITIFQHLDGCPQ